VQDGVLQRPRVAPAAFVLLLVGGGCCCCCAAAAAAARAAGWGSVAAAADRGLVRELLDWLLFRGQGRGVEQRGGEEARGGRAKCW